MKIDACSKKVSRMLKEIDLRHWILIQVLNWTPEAHPKARLGQTDPFLIEKRSCYENDAHNPR
jgi:hypothetical protein